MAEWNYNRIGEDGRLYSYYGKGQEWKYTERGRQHIIKVIHFLGKPNGVQYYLISKDGALTRERVSAARLHYFLNQKKAEEVSGGTPIALPLQIQEVKDYFQENSPTDCEWCGGCGLDEDDERICTCAYEMSHTIKSFNAQKRIDEFLKRVEA